MSDKDDILQQAIHTYGVEAQVDQAIEECGELIVALMQHRRDRVSLCDVAEEVADVQIMCEQMAMVVGRDEVTRVRAAKLARLETSLGHDLSRGADYAHPAVLLDRRVDAIESRLDQMVGRIEALENRRDDEEQRGPR